MLKYFLAEAVRILSGGVSPLSPREFAESISAQGAYARRSEINLLRSKTRFVRGSFRPALSLILRVGVEEVDFQIIGAHGVGVAVAPEDVEDGDVAWGIMGERGGVVEGRPRTARGLDLGIGAARRLGVVPDQHYVRRAVLDIRESFAARSSRDVIHAVTDLISEAQRWTARDLINAIGTFVGVLIAFQEKPCQSTRGIIVGERIVGRGHAIVIRRPPDFIGPGHGGRRSQLIAIKVRAIFPGRGAEPITRQRAQRIVVEVEGDADLVKIIEALGATHRRPRLLHGRQQERDQYPDDDDHHEQLDQREGRAK